MEIDDNVYVVLKTVTYHVDGESFDSEIEGVYADENIAKETAAQIRKDWDEEHCDDEEEYYDEAPELEVEVIKNIFKCKSR